MEVTTGALGKRKTNILKQKHDKTWLTQENKEGSTHYIPQQQT